MKANGYKNSECKFSYYCCMISRNNNRCHEYEKYKAEENIFMPHSLRPI